MGSSIEIWNKTKEQAANDEGTEGDPRLLLQGRAAAAIPGALRPNLQRHVPAD